MALYVRLWNAVMARIGGAKKKRIFGNWEFAADVISRLPVKSVKPGRTGFQLVTWLVIFDGTG